MHIFPVSFLQKLQMDFEVFSVIMKTFLMSNVLFKFAISSDQIVMVDELF